MKKYLLFLAIGLNLFGTSISEEISTYEFNGNHYIASYLDCDHDALVNLHSLKEEFLQAVNASGATILDSVDYIFPPDGFTMVVLLSESHASIHTYPEHNACFIDLFTCGTSCDASRFEAYLKSVLKPQKVEFKHLIRNQETKLL
jgi:S-adenosylmethionine decarboxylase